MSTHNIGFYEDLTKIIFELSSNMHLISSAAEHSLSIMACGKKCKISNRQGKGQHGKNISTF